MATRSDYIDCSDEYFAAIEVSEVAYAIFAEATKVFRAGGSFEAFGEAQKVYAEAKKAFDAAYEVEQNRPVAVDAEAVEDNSQLNLF